MKLAIIIPAYNEAVTIGQVLDQIPKKIVGISKIQTLVVNDGSLDNTKKEALKSKALVLNHRINLGVGAATSTGLHAASKIKSDIAVTLDGDGQHDPSEIENVIKPIINGEADLVIGSRLLDKTPPMPPLRLLGNRLFNYLTFFFYGIKSTDSQSGFKAFSKRALELLDLKSNGYEVCSEILAEASKLDLRVLEVPISVIYNRHSLLKGQHILNGLNIFLRLIYHKLKLK